MDTDRDGAPDVDEDAAGTDPLDPDSDDDGVPDGTEWGKDSDGDGVPDALECDSDGDGLADGLERGVSVPGPGTDLLAACFVADADPGTVTDPTRADTDAGGRPDGAEDANGNGRVDAGEGDPQDPADDACSPQVPTEIADLRISVVGPNLRFTWVPGGDVCATYTLLESPDAESFAVVSSGIAAPEHVQPLTSLAGDSLRFYQVRAVSPVAGPGL